MSNKVNKIFKAIADPTRREIFHVLVAAGAALSINQVSEQFDMSRQGVSKHLKLLQEAGMVKVESKGRETFCVADANPLKEIQNWLSVYDRFWDEKLDLLSQHLDNKKTPES
ncbi:MAG: DNA-binding transcriptional ArsR family regulator [Crocinitomicaceae bacterium]|jgi:DNA-binding transcriptional ArsR family regulator